jgi:hypothetical protein
MVLEIKKVKDKFLDKVYEETMNEFNNFFELRWETNKPSIIKVPDRETIDHVYGRKTEDWIVGWASEKEVFVLDRKNYEKESCHKYSDEEYIALVKHEISHLYISILTRGGFIPNWLNEGICIYISGQNKFKKSPESFKIFLKYFGSVDQNIYGESGFAIELLIKKYKKEKLIKFLNELKDVKNKKEFVKKFEKIYKVPLEYKTFNKFLEN